MQLISLCNSSAWTECQKSLNHLQTHDLSEPTFGASFISLETVEGYHRGEEHALDCCTIARKSNHLVAQTGQKDHSKQCQENYALA